MIKFMKFYPLSYNQLNVASDVLTLIETKFSEGKVGIVPGYSYFTFVRSEISESGDFKFL